MPEPSDTTTDVINQAARVITANWLTKSPLKMAQALAEAGLLSSPVPASPATEAKGQDGGESRA